MVTRAAHTAVPIDHPARPAVREGGRTFYLGLWGIFLIAIPYYFFRAGRPQIADFLAAGMVLLVLVGPRFELAPGRKPAWKLLARFVGYATLVNLLWFVFLQDLKLGFAAVYYVFNMGVFVAALKLHQRYGDAFLRVTFYAIAISLVIQAAFAVVGGGGFRAKLFFNNPNQLGYYALAASTIAVLVAQRMNVSWRMQAILLLCGLFLIYVSHSRAAMLSIAVLIATLFVRRPAVIVVGAVLLAGALFAMELGGGAERTRREYWERRLSESREKSMEGHMRDRGMERIYENPQHLLLGAGEGGYGRFNQWGMELHSSAGTIIFSYGVIGLALFGTFVWWFYSTCGFRVFVFLLPVLLYGLTHQGLRFRIFWAMLAVALAVGFVRRDEARARAAPLAPAPSHPT